MADLIQIGIDVKTNIKQATADLDKMGGSVLGNVQKFDRLEAEVKQLNKALAKGRVNEAAYARGMKQINGELLQFQQRAAKAAQVERKFGAGAASGGKTMNRFNVALQQGGFQLQDFAVQMQSGTSFFTAFGQQGSQFAGIFGPGGAVIGAVIAIGSAIGGIALKSFMASKEVKTLEDSLSGMKGSLSDFVSSMELLDNYNLESLSGTITNMNASMMSLAKSSAELSRNLTFIDAIGSMQDLNLEVGFFAAITGSFKNLFKDFGVQIDQTTRKASNLLEVQAGKLKKFGFAEGLDISKYNELIAEIKSGLESQDSPAVVKAIEELVTAAQADGTEDITKAGQTALKTLQEIAKVQQEIVDADMAAGTREKTKAEEAAYAALEARLKFQFEAMQKIAEADADSLATAIKNRENSDDFLASMKAENNLLILKVLYTGDALGLKRAEAVLAREAFKAEQVALNLHPKKIKLLMEEYDLSVSLTQRTLDAAEAIKLQTKLTKEAATAMKRLSDFGGSIEKKLVVATAKLKALKEGGDSANASMNAGLLFTLRLHRDIAVETALNVGNVEAAKNALIRYNKAYSDFLKLQGVQAQITANTTTGSKGGQTNGQYIAQLIREIKQKKSLIGLSKEEVKVATLRNKIKEKGIKLTDENVQVLLKEQAELTESTRISEDYQAMISDIRTGLTDAFTSVIEGTKSVGSAFKDMIRQMLMSLAQKSFIQPLVGAITGGASASMATQSLASGSGAILGASGSIAAGASALGSGLYAGAGSALGFGSSASVVDATKAATGAMGSLGTSLGAVAGPLLAVVAIVSFFKKKVKELDSGLQGTVTTLDATIESFSKIKTTRFFGLSKKVSTSSKELSEEEASPFTKAVQEIQMGVMDAAEQFGIAADVFDDFSYDFKLSLKGLSEEAKSAAIAEEFIKMGDAFASMTGLFENMNQLMAVYQERLNIEKQLLVAQGDVVELRKQELETVHVLNRALAARLHLMQAEDEVKSAIQGLVSAISERQGLIRKAADVLVSPLQKALDLFKNSAQDSFKIFKEASGKVRTEAKALVDIIRGALDSRKIKSEAVELQNYRKSQQQLTAFAGGAEFDKESLGKAAKGVSIDSEKFFGSFADYARDFYKTQITLEELEAKAAEELTDVEVQIAIAEKAFQMAMNTYQESVDMNTALDTLLTDLAAYNEASNRNEPFIEQIKAEGDRQIAAFDKVLEEAGLMATSNMSVAAALEALGVKEGEIAGAVTLLKKPVEDIGSHMENFDASLAKAYDDLGTTINDLVALDIAGNLKELDFFAPLENVDFTAIDEETLNKLSGIDLATLFNENVTDLSEDFNDNADLKKALDESGLEAALTKNAILLGEKSDDLNAKIIEFSETANTAIDNLASTIGADDTTGLSGSVTKLGASAKEAAAALADAMTGPDGLNTTVDNLSTAVYRLADSNTALASAQKAQADATASANKAKADAAIASEIKSLQEAGGAIKTGGTVIGDQSGNIVIKYDDGTRSSAVSASGGNSAAMTAYYQVKDSEAKQDALRQQIADLGGEPAFASGGMHSGGLRLVGENGPELEATGPSRVYSAQQTRSLMSGGSGEVVQELRSLRREVSELKSEQRKVGVENVKYNKKSYDLYREWDTVGLPATRTA